MSKVTSRNLAMYLLQDALDLSSVCTVGVRSGMSTTPRLANIDKALSESRWKCGFVIFAVIQL